MEAGGRQLLLYLHVCGAICGCKEADMHAPVVVLLLDIQTLCCTPSLQQGLLFASAHALVQDCLDCNCKEQTGTRVHTCTSSEWHPGLLASHCP